MGKSIQVTVEGDRELLKKLDALGVNVKAEVKAAVEAGGAVIAQAANAKRSGMDVSSPRVTAAGQVEVSVGPVKEKWHLRFFETGTRAHVVKAKNKPYLRFRLADGTWRRMRQVTVPAIPARPFLRPAFDESQTGATDAVGEKLKRAVLNVASG